jgi:hypothetical protein
MGILMKEKLIAEILMHCRRLKALWRDYDELDEIEVWVDGVWKRVVKS